MHAHRCSADRRAPPWRPRWCRRLSSATWTAALVPTAGARPAYLERLCIAQLATAELRVGSHCRAWCTQILLSRASINRGAPDATTAAKLAEPFDVYQQIKARYRSKALRVSPGKPQPRSTAARKSACVATVLTLPGNNACCMGSRPGKGHPQRQARKPANDLMRAQGPCAPADFDRAKLTAGA